VRPTLVPRLPVPWPGVTDFHECNVRTYVRPRRIDEIAACAARPAAEGRESARSTDGQGDDVGVWFFSLDAASRLAVWGARRFFHLPYHLARMHLERRGDEIDYQVRRIVRSGAEQWGEPELFADRVAAEPTPHRRVSVDGREVYPSPSLRCRWRAGQPLAPSQPGELAHFLTERYCLYSVKPRPHDAHADEDGGHTLYRCPIAHQAWPLRDAELLELDDTLMQAAGIAGLDEARGPVLHHCDQLEVRAWMLERVR